MLLLPLRPRKGGGGHGSSGGHPGGKASSGAGHSSSKSTPLTGSSKSASSASRGGGDPFVLSSGVFSGRTAGGGSRTQIYGSSYYGSGYPYGGYGYWLDSRPLPYVYWPVYVYPNGHYGSHEYGPASNSSRPGGVLTAAVVRDASNLTDIYRIMGDNSSVASVLSSLVSKCHVQQSTIYPYDPESVNLNSTIPKPEQIIQYYRASTFVLSLDGYNNTAALASNAPSSNTTGPTNGTRVPLPTNLDPSFLSCLNSTIGQDLPLVDPPKHLSTNAIVGIVIGSIAGAVLLLLSLFYCCGGIFRHRFGSRSLKDRFALRRNKHRYDSLSKAEEDEVFRYDETLIPAPKAA